MAGRASGLNIREPSQVPPAHPRCRCGINPKRKGRGHWVYVWLTAMDDRVCPICGPMEGKEL